MTILRCKGCGGTHYGALECPYRCERCGTNTEPCNGLDCPRNARWNSLPHFTAEPVAAAQKIADTAIGDACTAWLKTVTEAGRTPYPRAAFHAGAVWMAQQIDARLHLSSAIAQKKGDTNGNR